MRLLTLLLGCLSLPTTTALLQADTAIQSGPKRAHLLELYTSEGCSSCPPAESWFSRLKNDSRLWKEVIPLAFHVDYWDDLGWKDRLAAPAYTARQRSYAASWGTETVYTPGFVLDGREWRERDLAEVGRNTSDAGILQASVSAAGEVSISFRATASKTPGALQVHAALLGFDVSSDVKAGENRGRKLQHDFVVLALQSAEMDATNKATLHLPIEKTTLGKSALAVWITENGKTVPLQAAGGPL